MEILKKGALFTFGGSAYVGLELLYRRRSHISMFAAGGLCFLLLGRLERSHLSLPVKTALGALAVTAVELATGMLVNRNYTVWDYRRQPLHFKGQICPKFMLLWVPLSLAAMKLYRWADDLCEKLLLQ